MHSGERAVIKILFGLISCACLTAIYYTRSRGGIIGAAGGIGILFIYSIIVGKRDGKKWFAPAIIALPAIGGILIFLLIKSWSAAQETRGEGSELVVLFDNSIRLILLGIAILCVGLHPLIGGGSRSFSWECFRFWDYESMGQGSHRPEHVHNELLQTVCDYGIIGGALLVVFLVSAILVGTLGIASQDKKTDTRFGDAWRIAGIAGFVGLFIHSNFEGIFRIPPGAILLALCLAAACLRPSRDIAESKRAWFSASVISLLGLGAAIFLVFGGWKGARVTAILWPSFFTDQLTGTETRIDAFSKAIAVWPLGSLYQQRATLYHRMAVENSSGGNVDELLLLSLRDFDAAFTLAPFDPGLAVNSGKLLSALDRNPEAEARFAKAIDLQGGMEAGFLAHVSMASHLHKKGIAEHDPKNPATSLPNFQIAVRHIEKAFAMAWLGTEHQKLRVNIHCSYGQALEETGDFKAAMQQYDQAARLPHGTSAHYRAAMMLGRRAVQAWSERRSADALRLFMEAEVRANQSREIPAGITPEKLKEYVAYLRGSTEYLKGARIAPAEKINY
ncbi:MAG: O-antigen ligase family protein [Armatimonadetes bacterium]|nr:O-antigen ligase family protein [Akkermansiaceae bacterium]